MATYLAAKTFADGDYLSFTELNAAVGNNGSLHWLKNALHAIGVDADSGTQTVDSATVSCRVFGGAQQIPDSQWTALTWTDERWGRMDGRDQSFLSSEHPTFIHLSAREEVLRSRYYAVGGHVVWAGNTVGSRGLRIAIRVRDDLTTSYVVALKMKEATAAGAGMGMSISTTTGYAAGSSGVGGGHNFVVEVYQNSGDILEVLLVPGASPEGWITEVGV